MLQIIIYSAIIGIIGGGCIAAGAAVCFMHRRFSPWVRSVP